MISSPYVCRLRPAATPHRRLLMIMSGVVFLCATLSTHAQTTSPLPAPADTPVILSTPPPTIPPAGGGSKTIFTVVPGLPSAADMQAYDAARTPLVSVSLASVSPTGIAGTSATALSAGKPFPLVPSGGTLPSVTLQPAAAVRGKAFRASAPNSALAAQPVATVTLTYLGNASGELVWVQTQRGGTLTATDGAGKTYDGSKGFFLTVGAGGSTTFQYQAPNASGTYRLLTRYSNVTTMLTFTVPDPAPDR